MISSRRTRRVLEPELGGGLVHLQLEGQDQAAELLLRQRAQLALHLVALAAAAAVLAGHSVTVSSGRSIDRMSLTALRIVCGLMPCSALYATWRSRRRWVSPIALRHRLRHPVGVHDDLTVDVAGGTADHLDQRRLAAQEALLVGVEDRHQRHLGQVETLAEEVDADEHVELAEPQPAEDLDALDGVDVGVQVPHPQTLLEQVVGEVLGHLLGQRGDEHAVALASPDR